MLTYRQIETEPKFRKAIWRTERSAPEWFRDSQAVWTPTYRSFVGFWKDCREIWGLFDDEKLAAVVYLGFYDERSVNIHISVLTKLPEEEIVRFFSSLTRHKDEQGVVNRTAWILAKNRFLLRIAQMSGYRSTGLKLDYGAARGRVLRWVEVRG